MAKCWYRLNLDVENAISKDWQFPKGGVEWDGVKHWSFKEDKIFNPEWIKYMNDVALPINRSVVFYRGPNLADSAAHADLVNLDGVSGQRTYLGFNWVFGGAGSEMIWYDLPTADPVIKPTPTTNKILSWPLADLVEIDRCSIQNVPTLVRIDYPHSISVANEERWCVSARTTLYNLTWDEAVEHLKTKNIIIDR